MGVLQPGWHRLALRISLLCPIIAVGAGPLSTPTNPAIHQKVLDLKAEMVREGTLLHAASPPLPQGAMKKAQDALAVS